MRIGMRVVGMREVGMQVVGMQVVGMELTTGERIAVLVLGTQVDVALAVVGMPVVGIMTSQASPATIQWKYKSCPSWLLRQ